MIPIYENRESATERSVGVALRATLSLECRSPVVILGLDVLDWAHEIKADQPEIERAERYVAECWAEHTMPVASKA